MISISFICVVEENCVILLYIKIGLPYTHLQREIWNRPRKDKLAMLLRVLASNEVDRENGHSSKNWLLLGQTWVNRISSNYVKIGQCWYLAPRLWRITRSCIKPKKFLIYSSCKAKRWVRILIHQIWPKLKCYLSVASSCNERIVK